MLPFHKRIVKNFLDLYPKWLCKKEYTSQVYKRFNERPIEYSFIFRKIAEIYPMTILDVGSGTTALPHLMRKCGCLVTATDNVRDYWPSGMSNRHYHVIDDDITATRLTESYDMITCISVLEHINRPEAAIRNMFSLLKANGHLILTFPYSERSYVNNVYDLPGASYGKDATYITQSFSRTDVQRWMDDNGGVIVDQEYWHCWEGEHWIVGKQIIPPKRVSAEDKHQLTCMLIKKR